MSDATENVDSASDDRTANNSVRHQYRVLSAPEKAMMVEVKDRGAELLDLFDDLGNSREISIAKTFGERTGTNHTADVRRNHDHVVVLLLPDVRQQDR